MPANQHVNALDSSLAPTLRLNYRLQHSDTAAQQAALANTLFTIAHGPSHSNITLGDNISPSCVTIQTGLQPLNPLNMESWYCESAPKHFTTHVNDNNSEDHFSIVEFDDHILISASSTHFSTPRATTHKLYLRMLQQCQQRHFPHLLRAWNYMPNINQGQADNEVYRLFCIGRHEAFSEAGINANNFPAASALSHKAPELLVYLIASKHAGQHFENPKQHSAYQYPKIYGPKSPSFARATLAPSLNSLFISGTASIIGHQSLHIGDPMKQLGLTLENIQGLVDSIQQRTQLTFTPALFKVYIRHAHDYLNIQQAVKHWLGEHTPCIFLLADICRQELLLEIEAHYQSSDTSTPDSAS